MKSPYRVKENCCGCSACTYVCGQHAISMKPDKEGFLYPVIDETKCIDCGMCVENCAFVHKQDTKQDGFQQEYYAVKAPLETRKHSQSAPCPTA